MERPQNKVNMIAIVGPTASGKTDLSIELAEKFNGEIVCADSRTVYRGMDIGTAKPGVEQRKRVKHHMLDLINPDQKMSAAEFKDRAQAAIADIAARGRVPFLVGGSGLYVDAVLFDYQFPEDEGFRGLVQLEAMSDHELRLILEAEDPDAAGRVDFNNRRRVIRAIETAGQRRSRNSSVRADTLVIGLASNKEVARERITKRLEKMLAEGLIDEVRRLSESYGWGAEAMTGIGYRAFAGVVSGSKSVEQAKADCIRGDLSLWKRQMTWFRRNAEIQWLENPDKAEPLVARFLRARV
jgi:tRNA dimethylallyltransferase